MITALKRKPAKHKKVIMTCTFFVVPLHFVLLPSSSHSCLLTILPSIVGERLQAHWQMMCCMTLIKLVPSVYIALAAIPFLLIVLLLLLLVTLALHKALWLGQIVPDDDV